jgi:hypothetical protein
MPWIKASAVLMPPPGAGKQPDGNEEEQKPVSRFAGSEHQNEQNDSDQSGTSGGQVMQAEVVEIHGFLRAIMAS